MSAQCQSIRDEIVFLEQHIDALDAEIASETDPKLKGALIRSRKQILSHLQRRRAALAACEAAPDAPRQVPTGFVDFGSEVTQGIPGYELVAGKDTLARVFVGARPPEVTLVANVLDDDDRKQLSCGASARELKESIHLPPFNAARIDYADLVVTGPTGILFFTGDIGDGVFTNDTQSFSEEDNVNFYIDGAQLSVPGSYDFTARFFRNGQIVAEKTIGRHQFHPTRDLRILIVVEIFPFPAPKWATLTRALEDMSRSFPIRAGLAPLDGDQTAGLRYRIEPTPIDFAWPDRTPVAERLAAFNAAQEAARRPDRAEHALTIRTQQPGEMPLGGNAQSGPDGSIAGVVLNVTPPMDIFFGTLVAHEIAHNFISGNGHVAQEGAAINAPAAFDLDARAAVTNPRALMLGTYNGTPSGTGFLLQDEWRTVRTGLLTKPSTGNS